jgi:hypothetical protein
MNTKFRIERGIMMYRILYSQMALVGMSKPALAEAIDMKYTTLLDKLAGRTKFTLDESVAIKKAIKSQLSIEALFDLDEEKSA